jgi:hypothetical protein
MFSGFLFSGLALGLLPESMALLVKKRLIFTLTTGFVIFISTITAQSTPALPATSTVLENSAIVEAASFVAGARVAEAKEVKTTAASSNSVENYVRAYYAHTPALAEIAKCESQFTQFNKYGEILRGREVPTDVGVMQINEYYHKKTAEKLGFNLYTVDGNLGYAQWLYDHQGTQPWSASQACWSR